MENEYHVSKLLKTWAAFAMYPHCIVNMFWASHWREKVWAADPNPLTLVTQSKSDWKYYPRRVSVHEREHFITVCALRLRADMVNLSRGPPLREGQESRLYLLDNKWSLLWKELSCLRLAKSNRLSPTPSIHLYAPHLSPRLFSRSALLSSRLKDPLV